MKRPEILTSVFSLIFFLFVISVLLLYGISGRVYLEVPVVAEVPESHNAFAIWNDKGIKGRILILFDRKPAITPLNIPAMEDNYVYLAIKENIIRKVIHVIPDIKWDEVDNILTENPSFRISEKGYLSRIQGVRLQVMRARDIPVLNERALLHINGEYWEVNKLAELLKREGIVSDIVTLTGEISDEEIRTVQGLL